MVRYNDGTIVASHRLEGGGALYSSDNGQSWNIRDNRGAMELGYDPALDLGNGEIFGIYPTPTQESGSLFKYSTIRSLDNGLTWKEEFAYMDAPLAMRTLAGNDRGEEETGAYRIHHGLVKLNSGHLLACGFGHNIGDNDLIEGYPPEWKTLKTRLIVTTSPDKGRTWVNPRTVAYKQLPAQEGFNECDMARARNGDIVLIVRTHNKINDLADLPMTPMYMLRSSDEGQTWSTPKAIEDFGGNPNIVSLDNGVMVASFSGGPGSYIAVSENYGQTWARETELSKSDSDTNLIQTGPDSVMAMHYDDTSRRLLGTYFTIRSSFLFPIINGPNVQLKGSGLCITAQGTNDTGVGATTCADTYRQRVVGVQDGTGWRFKLSSTNTCIDVGSTAYGGIHGVSFTPCGNANRLWEIWCGSRWRNPNTGAVLYIEPVSASEGKVYGLSGYSGACNDPLSDLSLIEWVTQTTIPSPSPSPTPSPAPSSSPTLSPTPSGGGGGGSSIISTAQSSGASESNASRVRSTAILNVRASPSTSGTLIGTVSLGATGTVTGETINSDGYIWVHVKYDNGLTGWSVQNYLAVVTQSPAPIPSSPASCPNIIRNLARGSRGADIKQLQQFLISRNLLADGNDTGYFGAVTQAAVQAYQLSKGIVSFGTPTTTGYGAVGPRTRAALSRCN